ncbi:MAG: hypothetical protein KAI74_06935 [Kiritimatiellae bacterium]|nr:hypothetical protein [Kiritimatiellia bacterium]
MKLVKRLVVFVSVIACVGAMVGCDSSDSLDEDETKFENQSSATITVAPQSNETFAPFVLEPGNDHTVKRVGDNIDYTYTATENVDDVNIIESEVLFVDHINL